MLYTINICNIMVHGIILYIITYYTCLATMKLPGNVREVWVPKGKPDPSQPYLNRTRLFPPGGHHALYQEVSNNNNNSNIEANTYSTNNHHYNSNNNITTYS